MTRDHDKGKASEQEQESANQLVDFKRFLTVRVIGGIIFAVMVLWGFWIFVSLFDRPEKLPETEVKKDESTQGVKEIITGTHSPAVPSGHEAGPVVPSVITRPKPKAKGVAFVEATISVLDHELNERFWGWRRNDILRFTDNVENMQLGVLEVVRRASVTLAERISRHGPTDVIDKNLENAMNWFMIKPDRYWLPSPEAKYNDGLKELRAYAQKLQRGEARFYTRPDNLIPLLVSFAELLGSCDENLVKTKEEDGSPVTWFHVDDYFYYAKGVAKAMGKILHAVEDDFSEVLKARHGVDLLEHAIHACHIAAELDPWLVTDAALDGILANHRANMAAPISHARYYLGVVIKTLST
ncbi:MAG: DUF2333 family protein [Deltaproteobacteria bacterium]|nr:DUF2333 family protein [Deltaproteobacteria bacterium]MBW2073743.1 DUF2333 family protein [Deltaproteobacteria bacterium]